jgi:DNA polymerase epsilon subunit 4
VARIDNLEFLADVVPRTTTYRRFVAERGKDFKPGSNAQGTLTETSKETNNVNGSEASKHTRQHLSMHDLGINGTEEAADEDAMDVEERNVGEDEEMHDPIQEQLAMEMAGHERSNGSYS